MHRAGVDLAGERVVAVVIDPGVHVELAAAPASYSPAEAVALLGHRQRGRGAVGDIRESNDPGLRPAVLGFRLAVRGDHGHHHAAIVAVLLQEVLTPCPAASAPVCSVVAPAERALALGEAEHGLAEVAVLQAEHLSCLEVLRGRIIRAKVSRHPRPDRRQVCHVLDLEPEVVRVVDRRLFQVRQDDREDAVPVAVAVAPDLAHRQAVVGRVVIVEGQADLPQIVDAGRRACCGPCALQRGDEQERKDGQNAKDDEDLDQGDSSRAITEHRLLP